MQWECKFCGHKQIATNANFRSEFHPAWVGVSKYGNVGFKINAARCLNSTCNELTANVSLWTRGHQTHENLLTNWSLLPESNAKPQPDYIPMPLREDYFEACLIVEKSPKAAATLARRCLQGMIRDFCKIAKPRLVDEIKELRAQCEAGSADHGVTHEAIEAIDHVRRVGNIGAHMEKDINQIVEVDAGEAAALIELIEMLFDEWYVARHRRQQRLAALKVISDSKVALPALPGGTVE